MVSRVDRFSIARQQMVQEQIDKRGLHEPRLLEAFRLVPRHLFVPSSAWDSAYEDSPLGIGFGQTISQPYIVALMTSLAELHTDQQVLEVGTGSGYQAAILARLAGQVHTIEYVPTLALQATKLLAELKCHNVNVHQGDGSLGWPEAAPYDAILVTAGAPNVPQPLRDQLAEGGRLVIPVDDRWGGQLLMLLKRDGGKITEQIVANVAFVPLRGKYGRSLS